MSDLLGVLTPTTFSSNPRERSLGTEDNSILDEWRLKEDDFRSTEETRKIVYLYSFPLLMPEGEATENILDVHREFKAIINSLNEQGSKLTVQCLPLTEKNLASALE